jgi:hypothetical protein
VRVRAAAAYGNQRASRRNLTILVRPLPSGSAHSSCDAAKDVRQVADEEHLLRNVCCDWIVEHRASGVTRSPSCACVKATQPYSHGCCWLCMPMRTCTSAALPARSTRVQSAYTLQEGHDERHVHANMTRDCSRWFEGSSLVVCATIPLTTPSSRVAARRCSEMPVLLRRLHVSDVRGKCVSGGVSGSLPCCVHKVYM